MGIKLTSFATVPYIIEAIAKADSRPLVYQGINLSERRFGAHIRGFAIASVVIFPHFN